jgi:hypothetical protein
MGNRFPRAVGVTSNYDSKWEDQQQKCCKYLAEQSHCQKEITVLHVEDGESHEVPAVSLKVATNSFLTGRVSWTLRLFRRSLLSTRR